MQTKLIDSLQLDAYARQRRTVQRRRAYDVACRLQAGCVQTFMQRACQS